jgi:hypothetical protein
MPSSHLYFILNPSLGTIKIGVADNVRQRHQGLEHACGVPLDVLGVLEGGAEYEHALHDVFYDTRLLGEWFSPSEELCAITYDPSSVPAFIAERSALIAHNRQRRAAAQAVELQASRERRKIERDAQLRATALLAHGMAIREDRQRTRRAARAAARDAALKAEEMAAQIASYSKSPLVVERLLAKELVAAADTRKADFDRIAAQRIRNAAFAGVRRAGARS